MLSTVAAKLVSLAKRIIDKSCSKGQ